MVARHCSTYEYPRRSLDVQNFFARPRLGLLRRGSSPTLRPGRLFMDGPGPGRGLRALFRKKAGRTGPSLRAVEGREGESKWALVMRGRRDKVSSERSVSVGPLRAVLLRAEKNAEKECLSSLFLPPRSAAETLPCGTANPVMYDRPQWWPETSRPPRTRGSRLTGGQAGRRG